MQAREFLCWEAPASCDNSQLSTKPQKAECGEEDSFSWGVKFTKKEWEQLQSSWGAVNTGDGDASAEGVTIVPVLKGLGTDGGMCLTLSEWSSVLGVR